MEAQPRRAAWRAALIVLTAWLIPLIGYASTDRSPPSDLLSLSLEELLSVEITSAARKSQSLSETAAAVYVISSEDIRRTGVRSIPEALRLAPGLQVAQIDSNKWAISARGFNGRFANKLLVLVDGRTVYTPSFSGVYWDIQDTLLDDVERIEVIRGPGSSVWGANAVNGVINIITKSSADTPGGLAKANYGSDQSHGGAIRYGGELTDNTSYRAFAKYDNYDSTQDFWGSDLADDWKMARIGGRIDSIRDKDSFTVIAEYHDTQLGSSYTFFDPAPPYFTQANADEEASGGFVLGRWRRQLNNDGELSVQAYIDAADRHYFAFAEDSVTYDVDMQYRLPEFSRHDIIVGAGYRLFSYDFLSTAFISVEPPSGDDGLLSAFIQDDMAFLDDRLSVIVGLKFEKNNRLNSETELLPSLRANWQIADKHSVWGSVSKSARTPSYADYTVNVQGFGPGIPPGDPLNPAPLPATFRFSGSPNAVNEELIAYELGYRGQLRDDLSLDVALFVNDYDDLQDSILVNTTCAPSGDLVPLCLFVPGQTNIVANTEATSSGSVDSVGGELALEWSPSDKLQFNAIYSLVDVDITADTASPNGSTRYGQYSKHQFSLRADIVMSASTSMNLWASYTDAIESIDIHDFWNLMARYAWRITHNTEVSIVGRNLLDSEHPEFVSELSDITPTEIERSVTAEVRYTF